VIGFLRWLGILNAAAWFGAALLLTLVILPGVFSPEMKQILGERNYPYFSQAISGELSARYFHLSLACAIVAWLHLGAERLYLGKAPSRTVLALLIALLVTAVFGSGWVQPRIKSANQLQHGLNVSLDERQQAAAALGNWRRCLVLTNWLTLGGVAVYLCRLSAPSEASRFVSAGKFRS
jgi:hypothetical protein